MPVIMDGSHIPARWAGKTNTSAESAVLDAARPKCLEVALINNMPDLALEDTELQFAELLDAAAGDILVRLQFYSLSGIPRSERVRERLSSSYSDVEELWDRRPDG